MTTGMIIKFLRNEKNLTQKDLSKILGVNISSIQKYESGTVNNLKMETIRTLCNYFNLPPIVFIFPETINIDDLSAEIYVEKKLIEHTRNMFLLNAEGIDKVIAYTSDLLASGKYAKKSR